MIHAAGLPSYKIQRTEKEKLSWYDTLGNRDTKLSHTADKTQRCAKAALQRIIIYAKIGTDIEEGFSGRLECGIRASVSLERFRAPDDRLHLLECEAKGKFFRDVEPMKNLRDQEDLLHNPGSFPFLEGGEDRITLQLNKKTKDGRRSENGSVEWKIPVYIIRFPKDQTRVIYAVNREEHESPSGKLDLKSLEKAIRDAGGTVVQTACVVQKFILQNSVLTVWKGGVKLDSIDLRGKLD